MIEFVANVAGLASRLSSSRQTPRPTSGVGKSSTSLHRLGLRRGVFACVGWQVILCDPIWQATTCSSEMDSH